MRVSGRREPEFHALSGAWPMNVRFFRVAVGLYYRAHRSMLHDSVVLKDFNVFLGAPLRASTPDRRDVFYTPASVFYTERRTPLLKCDRRPPHTVGCHARSCRYTRCTVDHSITRRNPVGIWRLRSKRPSSSWLEPMRRHHGSTRRVVARRLSRTLGERGTSWRRRNPNYTK